MWLTVFLLSPCFSWPTKRLAQASDEIDYDIFIFYSVIYILYAENTTIGIEP